MELIQKRLNIANNGDISFYEDTGTTPKLFWDASAESLGIGTSSPTRKLEVYDTTAAHLNLKTSSTGIGYLNFGDSDDDNSGRIQYANSDDSMQLFTNATERMRIDSSGNVGIGTTSPSTELHIASASPVLTLQDTDSTEPLSTYVSFKDSGGNEHGWMGYGSSSADSLQIANTHDDIILYTGSSGTAAERMRIDTSGNLLVGTTAQYGQGLSLNANATAYFRKTGDAPLTLRRDSTDGSILNLYKDGTTVGSIGTTLAGLTIGDSDTGLFFNGASDNILPFNLSTNATRDNAIDLGRATARFDDIYATNATIQTSDRNEKQDIAELSDAEQRVAIAAKGLLRKFRWKDSVAEKGDEARTHFGIIAQDLQAAFEAEGLDAGDYAMFISTTWTDEETNEEKTRMGVRYSELLAFIIAAL